MTFTFKVHVSSSRSVIDTTPFQNIEDAVVTIKDDNGSIIEILNYVENGFYVGQTFPQENQTYNLEVKHILIMPMSHPLQTLPSNNY